MSPKHTWVLPIPWEQEMGIPTANGTTHVVFEILFFVFEVLNFCVKLGLMRRGRSRDDAPAPRPRRQDLQLILIPSVISVWGMNTLSNGIRGEGLAKQ